MKFFQPQKYESWKYQPNTKKVIVSKNVKNSVPDNKSSCKVWGNNCGAKVPYKFNPNPIKHYRKQYTSIDTGSNSFSNNSLIGSLDKPGNNIISDLDLCDNSLNVNQHLINYYITNNENCITNKNDWIYDASLNRMVCTGFNPQSMVIKPATTVLDNNYSSSYREHLYSKCKTYNQNLPRYKNDNHINDCTSIKCSDTNCYVKFNPSNKQYQVQGPVTSSTRIASIKYSLIDCRNTNCKPKPQSCCETNTCCEKSNKQYKGGSKIKILS
jgi:hypothetical protein